MNSVIKQFHELYDVVQDNLQFVVHTKDETKWIHWGERLTVKCKDNKLTVHGSKKDFRLLCKRFLNENTATNN